ncbi:AMP-binding protein [bacterium]|nr:AMP-binding protein [bacterium]
MTHLTKLTVKQLIEESVRRYGSNPALGFVGQQPISYARLGQQIHSQSTLLHRRGVTHGDRVAIISENMPNWGIAYFSILYLGAVAVPVLPDFHASEIHHIIRHAGAKALYVSRKMMDKIEDLSDADISTLIIIDDFTLVAPETRIGRIKDLIKEGGREYAKLKESAGRAAGLIPAEVRETDLAAIIYTSGTTGHSKGVMLTHGNIIHNVISSGAVQPVGDTDRFLSILPLSHTYENTIGLLLPLMQGACIYYLDRPPAANILLPAMEKVRPTFMLSVPLILEKLYKKKIAPRLNVSGIGGRILSLRPIRKWLSLIIGRKLIKSFGGRIKFFGIGGAPLTPEVERFLRDAGFPYAVGYGLTETAPLLAGCAPGVTRFQSTGPAVKDVQLIIADPDPRTGEGEILAKGPNIMKGYYKDPDSTRAVFTEDGWFRTGDLGTFDADGYLYIKGRLKNVIIGPSGENIYPEEIEAHLTSFPYVLEAIVFRQDERLIAKVYLNYEELDRIFEREHLSRQHIRERIAALLEEMRTTINSRISVYSRIHQILEQPEPFEKTPTQKIKRYLYLTDRSV